MQVTVEVTQVFILQHWIEARTITDQGYWSYSLDDIYLTLNEAETERDEFHWDGSRTRIVVAEITTKGVIEEVDHRENFESEPTLIQKELFAAV